MFNQESNKNVPSLLPIRNNAVFKAANQTLSPMTLEDLPQPLSLYNNSKYRSVPDLLPLKSSYFNDNNKTNDCFLPLPKVTKCEPVLSLNDCNEPIPWEGPINYRNSFTSTATPENILNQMKCFCLTNGILDFEVNINEFQMKGRFFCEEHYMAEFLIDIYTCCENNINMSLVQILRFSGNHKTFNKFLQHIMNNMVFHKMVKTTQCPTLPLSLLLLDNFYDSNIDVKYLDELITTMEKGYQEETRYSASSLAIQSNHMKNNFVEKFIQVPNVINRLLSIIENCFDVVVVRCCVIILSHIYKYTQICFINLQSIESILQKVKKQWSHCQQPFGPFTPVEIASSPEVILRVDEALKLIHVH